MPTFGAKRGRARRLRNLSQSANLERLPDRCASEENNCHSPLSPLLQDARSRVHVVITTDGLVSTEMLPSHPGWEFRLALRSLPLAVEAPRSIVKCETGGLSRNLVLQRRLSRMESFQLIQSP